MYGRACGPAPALGRGRTWEKTRRARPPAGIRTGAWDPPSAYLAPVRAAGPVAQGRSGQESGLGPGERWGPESLGQEKGLAAGTERARVAVEWSWCSPRLMELPDGGFRLRPAQSAVQGECRSFEWPLNSALTGLEDRHRQSSSAWMVIFSADVHQGPRPCMFSLRESQVRGAGSESSHFMASVRELKKRVGQGRFCTARVQFASTRSTGLEPSKAMREAAHGLEKTDRA
ncbi:UNVERIFIED_ORG: hypothetical protein ABIB52_000645 [Arthrobacter sp. UYCu721]